MSIEQTIRNIVKEEIEAAIATIVTEIQEMTNQPEHIEEVPEKSQDLTQPVKPVVGPATPTVTETSQDATVQISYTYDYLIAAGWTDEQLKQSEWAHLIPERFDREAFIQGIVDQIPGDDYNNIGLAFVAKEFGEQGMDGVTDEQLQNGEEQIATGVKKAVATIEGLKPSPVVPPPPPPAVEGNSSSIPPAPVFTPSNTKPV